MNTIKRIWHLYKYDCAMIHMFHSLGYLLSIKDPAAEMVADMVADKLIDMLQARSKIFLEGLE